MLLPGVREPAIIYCSRCSAPFVVRPHTAKMHRTVSRPDGDPHYCKHCTNYFAA